MKAVERMIPARLVRETQEAMMELTLHIPSSIDLKSCRANKVEGPFRVSFDGRSVQPT
jgi:hypothetical protein